MYICIYTLYICMHVHIYIYIPMDPSTFFGSGWGIIDYHLEAQVPSRTMFGSIGMMG